jgi:ADP-ribose pyrophosphatase YjhB (NUDIX family)
MSNWLTNEEYDTAFTLVPRICIDLVIKSENKIALSLRKIEPEKDKWHLPGGIIYKNESIEEAVGRVAKKEVGVEVTIEKFLGYMEFKNEIQYGKNRHTISLVFQVLPKQKKFIPDSQSHEIKYHLNIPENTHPIHKNFILNNLDFNILK